MDMLSDVQKNEFFIPISKDTNICVLEAEDSFYYNNKCNFWCAVADNDQIIGSIGLKNVNHCSAEIKKFFVVKEHRGTGVGKKLMSTLVNAALAHNFNKLFLGSIDILKVAINFYEKHGFIKIDRSSLPEEFELCDLCSVFYEGDVREIIKKLGR
jgi:N-acetylglutamate synthase-like GNAT family acetyltransferase